MIFLLITVTGWGVLLRHTAMHGVVCQGSSVYFQEVKSEFRVGQGALKPCNSIPT